MHTLLWQHCSTPDAMRNRREDMQEDSRRQLLVHLGVMAGADQDLQRGAYLAAPCQMRQLRPQEGERLCNVLPVQVHKALAARAGWCLRNSSKSNRQTSIAPAVEV